MGDRAGHSKWFSYREFAADGQRELGLRYRPAVDRLVDELLHPLRERFGRVTVTSGMRTAEQNRLVGGAPRSKHRYASQPTVAAADVVCASGTPSEWASFLGALTPTGGIGVYEDHVHVDNRRTRARWSEV
jgi:uncharacterized protein YcbK (DUF882 family)